ncbi:MAG: hypothetical protein IH614_00190 [Desulfuromonadales bacterium]|nr:hypothetical protein [Desulfuromonadales bacterium]
MDLSIDYQCPACGKVLPLKLTEVAPGKLRKCSSCSTPVVLTDGGLQSLQRQLEEFCRS